MFNIGEIVRLKTGWTRMTVIGYRRNGDIIAKYSSNYGPSHNDFVNPELALNTQKRDPGSFIRLDGKGSTTGKNDNMTLKYQILRGKHAGSIGYFLNISSKGKYVLELENGNVVSLSSKSIKEIIPFTFKVRAVGSNYNCVYEAPANTVINEGDVLISTSGYIYCVLQVDTGHRDVKKVFNGSRLVQESL